jgi:hypothetical protein
MGSYSSCYLGPFYVGSTKGDVDHDVMAHFCAADKVVTVEFDALPAVLRQHYEPADDKEGDPPSDEFPFVYYHAPLTIVKDQLEVRGYTYEAACNAFAECIKLELKQRRQWAADHPEHFASSVRILEEQTVERWQEALRTIANSKLNWEDQQKYAETLIGEMLKNGHQSQNWYGYPGLDTNVPLRIAIEACSEGDELICDLTDLIWSETIKADDNFLGRTTSRTILLTEGRFDAFALSESLDLLFPHLRSYYSFMDFETYDPEGGAAALVKQVKAFAGAGIVNQIVAIFDNDAASHDAMRSLKSLKLPANIKTMHLPDLEFLRSYPTLGPAGESKMDVNGLAGSIELYLGRDVLLSPYSRDFVRVQWKGFVSGVGKYQGEVLDKRSIQERFREKLQASAIDRPLPCSGEWEDLRCVLRNLFEIFHEEDSKTMIETIRWQYEKGYSRA